MAKTFDFVVIGAGVFGCWTAQCLRPFGTVALIDAYGAANSRASSGGESRIIRMGYGPDALYTRWAAFSLQEWQHFFERIGRPLFCHTGVLWLVKEGDRYTPESLRTLTAAGIAAERLSSGELQQRFPQFAINDIEWGLLEPRSGVLMARSAVRALVDDAVATGVECIHESVAPPAGSKRLESVATGIGTTIHGSNFIFACGPWLPKLFPALLSSRLFITRQEVCFFGVPGGSARFRPDAMPTWLCIGDQAYGMPDLENRGVKIAFDRHGALFDPDSGTRVVGPDTPRVNGDYLAKRLPHLKNAPMLETRVCQYENTSNGDFIIDRHPEFDNVWLVGGGSGHGFKHGPAVGEYASNLVLGRAAEEPRFSLRTKDTVQSRTIF